MTITALVTSTLASHDKKKTLEAQKKEAEAKALYTLTHKLTGAEDMNDIADIAVSTISDIMATQAECFCFEENQIEGSSIGTTEPAYIKDAEFYNWPIYGRETKLGIIRIPKDRAETMSESQNNCFKL